MRDDLAELLVKELVTAYALKLEERTGKKCKPIKFIRSREGPYATEYEEHIEYNVLLTALGVRQAVNYGWITKRIFGVLVHEFVGHDKNPIHPPAKVVTEEFNRLNLSPEKRAKENVPLHFQLAICGNLECQELLERNGYGDLFKVFDEICFKTGNAVYIKWVLSVPRSFDFQIR